MSFKGKICSEGLWDESIPNITFDKNGMSNYAKLFYRLTEAYPRGQVGKKQWDDIVEKIKSKGKIQNYDCIIGISGGTDSSYLLHLAKEYDLKPLAVNLDNGWNSDISVKNIKKMTDKLNIDLFTYVVNYGEIKDLIKSYMFSGLPWIDMPTDLAIKSILYKVAAQEGVKFILRGNDFRSEGNQPTEWTYGDGRQLKYVHKKFGKVRLKTFPNYTIFSLLNYGLIKKIKSIYPYYYLDYNKNKAQKFLEENYEWEYYGGHHYENIFTKFVMSYWLYEKYGIDKRKITLSAQVLSKEIKREEAIEEIQQEPFRKYDIKEMINYVAKKLDLSKKEFDEIFQLENKTYLYYPSNYWLLEFVRKYAGIVQKLLFIHKPQSFYKSEVFNQ